MSVRFPTNNAASSLYQGSGNILVPAAGSVAFWFKPLVANGMAAAGAADSEERLFLGAQNAAGTYTFWVDRAVDGTRSPSLP